VQQRLIYGGKQMCVLQDTFLFTHGEGLSLEALAMAPFADANA
jgi:hypothetical protein